MASPRPAHVISRRAGRTTPVATRGWMGGVSRRVVPRPAPETSLCSASETPDKSPSLTRLQVRAGLHKGRGLSRRTWLLFATFKRIGCDPRTMLPAARCSSGRSRRSGITPPTVRWSPSPAASHASVAGRWRTLHQFSCCRPRKDDVESPIP
jgi:hypothetical protein